MQEAVEFVPACVTAIAAYWRRKGPQKKFKKCCGKAG
jgi:hypothetical protein